MATFFVNGVRLHAEVRGWGSPALVFLHYFAGSGAEWQEVIDGLEADHCCVALDLRGFGGSESSEAGYRVDEGADDLTAVLVQANLGDYVLVRHSMSGKIALVLAARQPAGLLGLVLIAPSPLSPEPIPPADRIRLLTTFGSRVAAEATADQIVAEPLTDEKRERVVSDNLRSSWPAWEAWLRSGSREDLTECYARITLPVRVLVGSEDKNMPLDVLENEVVASIADATLHRIDGSGHLLPLEKPQEIVRQIREFIAGGIGKIGSREPIPKPRSL